MESKIWHKWTYLWSKNRITNIENRLVVAKGEGFGEGIVCEVRISRCKLLYKRWLIQDIYRITRSYCVVQRTIFNILWETINGKEYFKKESLCMYVCMYVCLSLYVCMYVKLNHFAVQQWLTQHCKSTILHFEKIIFKIKKKLLSFYKWKKKYPSPSVILRT